MVGLARCELGCGKAIILEIVEIWSRATNVALLFVLVCRSSAYYLEGICDNLRFFASDKRHEAASIT